LAQLFVAPDRQSDGIGNLLISKTFAHAQMRGTSIKALITFTFNNVSQGLYISHGLFPRFPIYMVGVPRDAWRRGWLSRGSILNLSRPGQLGSMSCAR
jgi:GNAT superfamily N-acetyltransferase